MLRAVLRYSQRFASIFEMDPRVLEGRRRFEDWASLNFVKLLSTGWLRSFANRQRGVRVPIAEINGITAIIYVEMHQILLDQYKLMVCSTLITCALLAYDLLTKMERAPTSFTNVSDECIISLL